jgi:hypothetical protein
MLGRHLAVIVVTAWTDGPMIVSGADAVVLPLESTAYSTGRA